MWHEGQDTHTCDSWWEVCLCEPFPAHCGTTQPANFPYSGPQCHERCSGILRVHAAQILNMFWTWIPSTMDRFHPAQPMHDATQCQDHRVQVKQLLRHIQYCKQMRKISLSGSKLYYHIQYRPVRWQHSDYNLSWFHLWSFLFHLITTWICFHRLNAVGV